MDDTGDVLWVVTPWHVKYVEEVWLPRRFSKFGTVQIKTKMITDIVITGQLHFYNALLKRKRCNGLQTKSNVSQNDDRDAVVGGDEVKEEEYTQPPLPTEEISAPPPPPEPAQPSVTRSLISMDYGEDSDDGANSEASTEPNLSRTSSPFPPLEDVEILLTPSENSNNSEAKIPTGSKKSKVLTAASISMRKKKVSKLVEKWQKIQEELEQ